MNLERASWIATIIAAIFGIGWAILTYVWPPGSSSSSPEVSHSTTENKQRVHTPEDNNAIISGPDIVLSAAPNPENLLPTLTTGISRASLETQFGPAKFDDMDTKLGVRNLIFIFPRFFLQTVISRENKVIFYSVTTRSPDFRPTIPKLNGKLLESRFASFGSAEHFYSDMTSKYYEYLEKIYLGNQGNYRNIYLGFCPAGAPPNWGKFVPVVLADDGPEALKQFRADNVPNCFGVGDIMGDESKILHNLHMGIDYYVSRDIP